MPKANVFNMAGQQVGEIELSEAVFGIEPDVYKRQVSQLCGGEKYKGRLLFSAGEKPYLSLRLKKGEDALRAARALVTDYAAQLEEG